MLDKLTIHDCKEHFPTWPCHNSPFEKERPIIVEFSSKTSAQVNYLTFILNIKL